jgi:hypothetical protein
MEGKSSTISRTHFDEQLVCGKAIPVASASLATCTGNNREGVDSPIASTLEA